MRFAPGGGRSIGVVPANALHRRGTGMTRVPDQWSCQQRRSRERTPGSFGDDDDPGVRPFVVPAAALGVREGPPEAEAEGGP